MATKTHAHRVDPVVPYAVMARRERSRELAQKRRTTYKSLMSDLAQELPFSKDVISQVDYNSRLRLALCFFRMKTLLEPAKREEEDEMTEYEEKPLMFLPGMLQDLMMESLDGFLLVILSDGTIIYLSESIHKHMGLFQSEHIGYSIYDLILEEDHAEVKTTIAKAEVTALSRLSSKGKTECSFFCRMKCSRFKVANTVTKSPGYKLVFVSGHFKAFGTDPFLVTVVRPVSPPSILEIRMEGNMFVTHYSLDMHCTFFDGRLRHLMGYSKEDLIGHVPFEFHHHDDAEATLECSRGIMTKGEGLSSYYRFMNMFGQYVWIQSRATLMFDSRSGKPSYIVCMNFIISKDKGEKDLAIRQAITAGEGIPSDENRSLDPFPVPREDGKFVNPLHDPNDPNDTKPQISLIEEPSSTSSPPHKSQTKSNSPFSRPSSSSWSHSSTGSHSGSISTSIPNRNSTSPEDCLPDSTTSTDLGYGSISSSHTPNLSFRDPDTHSTHQDRSPNCQLSPISSVFSPERVAPTPQSVRSQLQHDSFSTSHGIATTPVTFPDSIPTPVTFPDSIPNSSHPNPAYSTDFDFPEFKYQPRLHNTQPIFMGQQHTQNDTQQFQRFGGAPTPQWNDPMFMKQEQTRHNSCRHMQQGGNHGNSHLGGTPFGSTSTSVIVIDDQQGGNHGNSHLGGTPFGGSVTASTSVIVIDDDIPPRMGSGPISSLPQLTGDDLKVLDFIEHMDEESSSVKQMPYGGDQFNFQRFRGVHT